MTWVYTGGRTRPGRQGRLERWLSGIWAPLTHFIKQKGWGFSSFEFTAKNAEPISLQSSWQGDRLKMNTVPSLPPFWPTSLALFFTSVWHMRVYDTWQVQPKTLTLETVSLGQMRLASQHQTDLCLRHLRGVLVNVSLCVGMQFLVAF